MTKETMIGMLRAARNGAEMIQVLDSLAGGYEYIESPQIAQVLGIPTLEPVEFWCYTRGVQFPSFSLSATHEKTPHHCCCHSASDAARVCNNSGQLCKPKLCPILYRTMPDKMTQSNWADNLTSEESKQTYTEIVHFLQEEVKREVLEKYNKPIAMKYQKV